MTASAKVIVFGGQQRLYCPCKRMLAVPDPGQDQIKCKACGLIFNKESAAKWRTDDERN